MAFMSEMSTVVARREAAREDTTGRFGEHNHNAPEVALATVESIEAEAQLRDQRRESEAEELAKFRTILDGVTDAAGMYAARRGQRNDVDDIIGDTIVDVVGQMKRGATHITDAAFLQRATRAVSSRYIDPNAHHTSLTARREFNTQVGLMVQKLGRQLTPRERKALADEIRLSEEPGNRPAIGFEQKNLMLSFDQPVTADGAATLGDFTPAEDLTSDYATATTKAAAANDALEEGKSFKAADARKSIWNILAEDGPEVAVKSLADDRPHRQAVAEFGGPAAVARAWQMGETAEDDAVNVALFAPFGTLSEKQQEQVTEILLRNEKFADNIWDSAMKAAVDVQARRSVKRAEDRAAKRQAQAE